MDLVPVSAAPPARPKRRAISLVQLSLSTAGILVISGAIGIGVHTSTYLQVAGYSLGYALSDAISAWATPSWLVSKGDIDVPLPLLSSGLSLMPSSQKRCDRTRSKSKSSPISPSSTISWPIIALL